MNSNSIQTYSSRDLFVRSEQFSARAESFFLNIIFQMVATVSMLSVEIFSILPMIQGYREFSRAKNSILIPVEDWDLEASTEGGSQGGVADSQVPRAMSELQTLDHLVQQAQIVQFKLDVSSKLLGTSDCKNHCTSYA